MAFKLRYETGIATTVQFIFLTLLYVVDGANKSVSQCVNGNGGCLSNIFIQIVLFVFITFCFGVLWLVGFAAQDRRSKRLAQLLIAGEGLVFLVGLYEFYKHSSIIGGAIGLVEFVSALWIIWLAFRLILARGGRVRSHHIVRHRPTKSDL
ncbi:hypothetical protein M1512_01660 [Patescibacteria group bacterium]|nr:hypothetical protein [Patescibacteria group bacterium]